MDKLVPRSPDARLREAAQTALAELPPLAEAMTAADLKRHEDAITAIMGTPGYCNLALCRYQQGSHAAAFLYGDQRRPGDVQIVHAPTWPQVIERARLWASTSAHVRRNARIRAMALAVIEVKDEYGLVTERDLTAKGFSQGEVEALGDLACERAGEMCQGHPFAIVPDATP